MIDRLAITLAAGDDGVDAILTLAAFAAVPVFWIACWLLRPRFPPRITDRCLKCGYNLRGLPLIGSGPMTRCPECGHRNRVAHASG